MYKHFNYNTFPISGLCPGGGHHGDRRPDRHEPVVHHRRRRHHHLPAQRVYHPRLGRCRRRPRAHQALGNTGQDNHRLDTNLFYLAKVLYRKVPNLEH